MNRIRARVVFLDFDGVLNSHAFWERRAVSTAPKTDRWEDDIDPEAVARVERLCAESDAHVVVSSTWRLSHTKLALQELLRKKGFTREVLGTTPDYTMRNRPGGLWLANERGHEIQGWLDDNARSGSCDVVSFVILDDDSDMAHLKPRHVKIDVTVGFTDADVERAAEILRRPMGAE